MDDGSSEHDIFETKLQDTIATPISLPLQFLKAITCNFSTEQELGRGGYGVVYKGVLRSGKVIAVKKLFHRHLVEDDNNQFHKEAIHLMGINHQNVVQLVGYCAESRWEAIKLQSGEHVMAQIPPWLLCFEYLCNGSLDKHISDESSGLDWNLRYQIIMGICRGLHFLHMECHIVHLDLKPQNILMDATMMPKIADFGLSRLLGEQKSRTVTKNCVGSLGYMAPEYINQGIISPKADIFSLGVIIIEILTGRRDYPNSNHRTQISLQHFAEKVFGSWRNRFATAANDTSPEIFIQQMKQCIVIALKCVDPDMEERPNASDILETLNVIGRSCDVENVKDSAVDQVSSNMERKLLITGPLQSQSTLESKNVMKSASVHLTNNTDDHIALRSLRTSSEERSMGSRYGIIPPIRMERETHIKINSCSNLFRLRLLEFYVPDYILKPGAKLVNVDYAPRCPVVVFINSRSGGKIGTSLIKTYRELLNEMQVYDLSEEDPSKVLQRLYANLERLRTYGNMLAIHICRTLKLIVAGGDGTANWLLGILSDLKLAHPPPVAIVPLGTRNSIPFSLGWGKKNYCAEQEAVKSFLGLLNHAREIKIDSWHIVLRMGCPMEGPCDPFSPLELPHSLHRFHRMSSHESLNVEGYHTFRGGFWSYFSMGIDAEMCYQFHFERKRNPEKLKGKSIDQGTYAKPGLKQAWLTSPLARPSSRNISQLAIVKIARRYGQWEEVQIPSSIQSIVCLNLPSFSGGLNPWGVPGTKKAKERDFTPPFVDDALIEVVGFRDAWQGLLPLSTSGHCTRLAQAHRIRFEFHKGAAEYTFMMVDGEPWKQPLPTQDGTVVIEICHFGKITVLANEPCRSISVCDPSCPDLGQKDERDDEEDELDEERAKFGAADMFKIPDEIDIAHLS